MNPLDDLKGIHVPSAIDSWPPAYGWWLLGIIILIIVFCTIKWALTYYKIRAVKRQAFKELELINNDKKNGYAQLNQLLKRVAMSYFPEVNVQQMHGDEWVEFLTFSFNKKQNHKFEEDITSLQDSLYQHTQTDDFERHKNNISNWLSAALPPKKSILEQLEREHA